MNRKLPLALALFPLVLSSCGKQGYQGYYSFQMGKNSGAHALASMTLTDEDHVSGGKTLGKKMSIYGEMKASPSSSSEESSSKEGEETPEISGGMSTLFEKGITIGGYYSIGDALENGRNAFRIGFDFKELLGDDFDEPIVIDNDVIEKFVYCEIDSRKIYLRIPVSFTDLEMQLYWYGFDLDWLSDLDEDIAFDTGEEESESESSEEEASSEAQSSHQEEVEAHTPGSKPTKEDIDRINKTYPASHNGELYRTFYTVSLALTRQ